MSTADESAVRSMSEWLAHPMEFGQQPTSCRVVATYDMEWPWHDEQQRVSLVEYTMPSGVKGIGIAGPIEWSFLDVPFEAFTHDELVKLYAGWYLVFRAINAPDYAPIFRESDDRRMIEMLQSTYGVTSIEIVDRYQIGDATYFELNAQHGGRSVKIAGTVDNCSAVDAEDRFAVLPVIYSYLGFTFYDEEE
jgi:hypothetical protein